MIAEADYNARYEVWQGDKIAKWEAAGSQGTLPRTDKSQFTRETHVTSKTKRTSLSSPGHIQFYQFQQYLLLFHTWEECLGFEVATPE